MASAACGEDPAFEEDVSTAIALSLGGGGHSEISDQEKAGLLMDAFAIAKMEEQEFILEQCKTTSPNAHSQEYHNPVHSDIVVELSGLPWSASEGDIKTFLVNCEIIKILIIMNDHKKPSGNAKVWLKHQSDLEKALLCDRKNLGQRYVCVKDENACSGSSTTRYHSNVQPKRKIETAKPKNNKQGYDETEFNENAVELTGLPWTATEDDIKRFLADCKILKIVIILNDHGKPSGNAKVLLEHKADLEKALSCDKNYIGQRYVYVRKVNQSHSAGAPSSYIPQGVCTVQLKGLPWSATQEQICDFLAGCQVDGGKEGVHIEMNERGKPSGSAFVQLKTDADVEKAMKFHKEKLGTRYVDVVSLEIKIEEQKKRKEKIIVKLCGAGRKTEITDISDLLSGHDVKYLQIVRHVDDKGKPSGDFYIHVENEENRQLAFSLDKATIGNRKIEVCCGKEEDFEKAINHNNEKQN